MGKGRHVSLRAGRVFCLIVGHPKTRARGGWRVEGGGVVCREIAEGISPWNPCRRRQSPSPGTPSVRIQAARVPPPPPVSPQRLERLAPGGWATAHWAARGQPVGTGRPLASCLLLLLLLLLRGSCKHPNLPIPSIPIHPHPSHNTIVRSLPPIEEHPAPASLPPPSTLLPSPLLLPASLPLPLLPTHHLQTTLSKPRRAAFGSSRHILAYASRRFLGLSAYSNQLLNRSPARRYRIRQSFISPQVRALHR